MSVKEHYDNHLGDIYAWMAGDFDKNVKNFQHFITKQVPKPSERKTALDLGAGHGIQSMALANLGYLVTAVDFNRHLLNELESHKKALPINIVQSDISDYIISRRDVTDLIICWGDTLTHLENKTKIEQLLYKCSTLLADNGHVVLSFRDYTTEATGNQVFIPVKSSDTRILTCALFYEDKKVRVTDLLHEKSNGSWQQKVSHYYKTRIGPADVSKMLTKEGLKIIYDNYQRGVATMIAKKQMSALA